MADRQLILNHFKQYNRWRLFRTNQSLAAYSILFNSTQSARKWAENSWDQLEPGKHLVIFFYFYLVLPTAIKRIGTWATISKYTAKNTVKSAVAEDISKLTSQTQLVEHNVFHPNLLKLVHTDSLPG